MLILTVWQICTASFAARLADTPADIEIRAAKAVWPQTISLDDETDQMLTYYIVVENRGTEPVDVEVADHVPDYTHLSPESNEVLVGTGEFQYDPSANRLAWNGTLGKRDGSTDTVLLRFDAIVESSVSPGEVITNTAGITYVMDFTLVLTATTTIVEPSPTPTSTRAPTYTPTATHTSTPTDTSTPTITPTPTHTLTSTPTPTMDIYPKSWTR